MKTRERIAVLFELDRPEDVRLLQMLRFLAKAKGCSMAALLRAAGQAVVDEPGLLEGQIEYRAPGRRTR